MMSCESMTDVMTRPMFTNLQSRSHASSLMLVLMLDSCIGKRITKANVDQVTEGMSKEQVESILGLPTFVQN